MNALRQKLGRRARFAEPMSAHTTWGVGGPAWALCRVISAEEAAFVIAGARAAGLPWMCLGGGSNLLVRDGGYEGVMLRLSGQLARLEVQGSQLQAGGGTKLAAALRLAARSGLAGLEWAAGIPGTVGGAVAGNAGAADGQMSDLTGQVTLLLADGQVQDRPGSELPAAYRSRSLPAGSLVLAARLDLAPDKPQEITRRQARLLAQRKVSQPLGQRTAGSVFKNPADDYAGRLIEEAGLKGLTRGGAMVSPKHANFLVNRGQARAADLLALIEEVTRQVRERSGVELELEVKVVGHD